MQPNKEDIVKATLEHPWVQNQIDIHVGHWVQQKRRFKPAVRVILTDFARQVAERIVDNPPPTPDFSADWRERFGNHAYNNALPYPEFKREIVPQVAAKVRGILEEIDEDALSNGIHSITLVRIAQHAGAVAGMIYHRLDPKLLEATEEEIAIEQLRLAQSIAENHPEKVIVMPDDVEPIDVILEIQKRMEEQEGEEEDESDEDE